MNKIQKPPGFTGYNIIKYLGGKSQNKNKILPFIPENDVETFIEPFAGGLAITLHLLNTQPNIKRFIASDIEPFVANFWTHCISQPEELQKKIDYIRATTSIDDLKKTHKEWVTNPTKFDPLYSAAFFLITNKIAYAGYNLKHLSISEDAEYQYTTGHGLRYKTGYIFNALDYYIQTKSLSKIQFHFQDYQKTIEMADNRSFIYLDPPYHIPGKNYYGAEENPIMGYFDPEKLFQFLQTIKNPWLMSYNNSEYIKNLYEDYNIKEYSIAYGMLNKHPGQKGVRRSELLIANYDLEAVANANKGMKLFKTG